MNTLTRTRRRSLNDLQREIDDVFGRFFSSRDGENGDASQQAVWAPPTDLVETDEEYRIRLDVPGMKKEDLSINYQDDQLTVSGERPSDRPGDDAEYVRVERAFGHFYRAFSLPNTVDVGNISAEYDSGVLTIHVPKAESEKPRQIEIQ